MDEALVLLLTDDAFAGVARWVTVTQHLPPRILAVSGDETGLAALRGLPGVVVLDAGTVPEAVWSMLSPTEQLFVDAWFGRLRPKQRPGNGLPWDAPPFQPPDAPRD